MLRTRPVSEGRAKDKIGGAISNFLELIDLQIPWKRIQIHKQKRNWNLILDNSEMKYLEMKMRWVSRGITRQERSSMERVEMWNNYIYIYIWQLEIAWDLCVVYLYLEFVVEFTKWHWGFVDIAWMLVQGKLRFSPRISRNVSVRFL